MACENEEAPTGEEEARAKNEAARQGPPPGGDDSDPCTEEERVDDDEGARRPQEAVPREERLHPENRKRPVEYVVLGPHTEASCPGPFHGGRGTLIYRATLLDKSPEPTVLAGLPGFAPARP